MSPSQLSLLLHGTLQICTTRRHRTRTLTHLRRAGDLLGHRGRRLRHRHHRVRSRGLGLLRTCQIGSRFLTAVSRRLQAPLGTVLKFSRVLRDRSGNSLAPRRTRVIGHVFAGNGGLLGLIGSVLSLSGLRTRHLALAPAAIGLRNLIQKILSSLRSLTRNGTLALRRSLTLIGPLIRRSRRHLHRILAGLVSGTIGFDSHNCIHISTARTNPRQPSRVVLAITSANVNVTTSRLARIFRTFHRISRALQQQQPNAKLNLTVIRSLIAVVNNAVTMRDRLNRKSIFVIALPHRVTNRDVASKMSPGPSALT